MRTAAGLLGGSGKTSTGGRTMPADKSTARDTDNRAGAISRKLPLPLRNSAASSSAIAVTTLSSSIATPPRVAIAAGHSADCSEFGERQQIHAPACAARSTRPLTLLHGAKAPTFRQGFGACCHVWVLSLLTGPSRIGFAAGSARFFIGNPLHRQASNPNPACSSTVHNPWPDRFVNSVTTFGLLPATELPQGPRGSNPGGADLRRCD